MSIHMRLHITLLSRLTVGARDCLIEYVRCMLTLLFAYSCRSFLGISSSKCNKVSFRFAQEQLIAKARSTSSGIRIVWL